MIPSRHPLEGAEIAVPGSVGNVGPGFDTLGLALQLYLRVRVVTVNDHRPGALQFQFLDGAPEGENLIEKACFALAARIGVRLPGLLLEVRTEVPSQAGLGSSAAAVVAGLKLCEAFAGERPLDDLLTMAGRLEGHADNAAASLLGGLTSCWERADGTIGACSSRWPDRLALVVATPAVRLRTRVARGVLPESIPRADAVFNLQRVLLLLHALERNEFGHLREALCDRWHQEQRQPLVPGLKEVLSLDHPDLLGVCLSGSGPSVIAFATGNVAEIETLLSATYAAVGVPCSVGSVRVDQRGAVWGRVDVSGEASA